MKLPTLFGRTPKHQKFSFEPRFYDPKKEEREQRNRRIQRELATTQTDDVTGFENRIKGSFHSARKRSQATSSDLQAALLRIVIILVLVVFFIAYLQWGNKAMWGLLVVVPIYAWIKLKR